MHPTIDASALPSDAFIEAQIDALLREGDIDLALSLQFVVLYHSFARRFLRRAMSHGSCAHANPLQGQGQVIALLKQQDGLSTRELADLMGIRSASLNELLVKLEAKGLITRCKSEADGRVTVAHLTEAGRSVEQAPFLSEMSSFYMLLSDEEKRTLITLLSRIEQTAQSAPREETSEDLLDHVPWSKLRAFIDAHGTLKGEASS